MLLEVRQATRSETEESEAGGRSFTLFKDLLDAIAAEDGEKRNQGWGEAKSGRAQRVRESSACLKLFSGLELPCRPAPLTSHAKRLHVLVASLVLPHFLVTTSPRFWPTLRHFLFFGTKSDVLLVPVF